MKRQTKQTKRAAKARVVRVGSRSAALKLLTEAIAAANPSDLARIRPVGDGVSMCGKVKTDA